MRESIEPAPTSNLISLVTSTPRAYYHSTVSILPSGGARCLARELYASGGSPCY
jgi:hypothetical protein